MPTEVVLLFHWGRHTRSAPSYGTLPIGCACSAQVQLWGQLWPSPGLLQVCEHPQGMCLSQGEAWALALAQGRALPRWSNQNQGRTLIPQWGKMPFLLSLPPDHKSTNSSSGCRQPFVTTRKGSGSPDGQREKEHGLAGLGQVLLFKPVHVPVSVTSSPKSTLDRRVYLIQ